jgi:hypothetical protein
VPSLLRRTNALKISLIMQISTATDACRASRQLVKVTPVCACAAGFPIVVCTFVYLCCRHNRLSFVTEQTNTRQDFALSHASGQLLYCERKLDSTNLRSRCSPRATPLAQRLAADDMNPGYFFFSPAIASQLQPMPTAELLAQALLLSCSVVSPVLYEGLRMWRLLLGLAFLSLGVVFSLGLSSRMEEAESARARPCACKCGCVTNSKCCHEAGQK